MNVLCWCCGRSSEAANLHTQVPVALKRMLDEFCESSGRSISDVVQQSLTLLITPPKDDA